MKRFNIFIKSEKFNWTINKLMLLLLAVGYIVWQINDHFRTSKYYKEIDKSLMYIFLFAFFGGTIYKFSRIAKPEKLNGKLVGFLEFKLDSIMIDQKQYSIEEIEKISIVNNDFYGKATGSSRGFDSNLSNGVDNFLTLTLKDKSKVSCMFEIYYEHDIRKLDEVIISYYSRGKLDFNQVIKILKLESSEIETFKRIYNV